MLTLTSYFLFAEIVILTLSGLVSDIDSILFTVFQFVIVVGSLFVTLKEYDILEE